MIRFSYRSAPTARHVCDECSDLVARGYLIVAIIFHPDGNWYTVFYRSTENERP